MDYVVGAEPTGENEGNGVWVVRRGVRIWIGPQGDYWKNNLRTGRVGSSSVSAACGRSRFKTPYEVAMDVLGLSTPIVPNDAMAHGTLVEPLARAVYERWTGTTVQEVGIMYPKGDLVADGYATGENGTIVRVKDKYRFPARFAAGSPDGLVGERGGIECKGPKVMYPKLAAATNLDTAHERGDFSALKSAIYDSHYDQMMYLMYIGDLDWMDYVVFCKTDRSESTIITRVPFDALHWENVIMPGLVAFHSLLVRLAIENGIDFDIL